jgi:type II secretory ATPase GspE/PulE/Tfp pilus assembly ATPase PilB-like protein
LEIRVLDSTPDLPTNLSASADPLSAIALTLADAYFLVSFWKPILYLVPMCVWAWIISSKIDKFTARFFLKRSQWNLIHLVTGMVALAVGLLIPLPGDFAFIVGVAAMTAILAAELFICIAVLNKNELVPAEHRFNLSKEVFGAGDPNAKKKEKAQSSKSELVLRGPDKAAMPVPAAEAPEYQVRVNAEGMVLRSIVNRASQIDLAPTGKDSAYGEILLVDGMKQAGQTFPAADAIKVIDLWKTLGKLDVNDRRKKLTADVVAEKGELKKKVRLTAVGIPGGMRLTMLFDPEKAVRRKPEDLGLLDAQMTELKSIVDDETKGTVLVCSPPDGGRTTILYTLMKMHDAYTSNVQTIEIEPQDELEGIRLNKWDPQAEGPEFSTLVRSILRRDPDVVGVAELPDQNTAKEIARADQGRTRIYVSFKADNAINALQTWFKASGELEPAAAAVRGVIVRRLMRRLCTTCRQPYAPSADMLKKFNIPAGGVKELYKKGGVVLVKDKEQMCPNCQGVGYIDQIGFHEIYKIDQTMRDALKQGDWNAFRAELKKKQLPSLQGAALRHAIEGKTSIEEVVRVTTEAAPAAGAAPAAAKPAAAPQPAAKPAKS